MNVDKVLLTLSAGPDRQLFRVVSLLLAVVIWSIDKLLGGSWRSFFVATVIIALMNFLLPVQLPRNAIRVKILMALKSLRGVKFSYQLMIGLLTSSLVTLLAANFSQVLGRQFNLVLLSIVVVGFFFPLRVAILTWLSNFLLVYLLVIPPSLSLAVYALDDFARLVLYFYLGLAALAIPALIHATSCRESRGL